MKTSPGTYSINNLCNKSLNLKTKKVLFQKLKNKSLPLCLLKMDRNRLRTLLNSFILIWMFVNLNTVVDGGDGTSVDSIVEFRPQGKFLVLMI